MSTLVPPIGKKSTSVKGPQPTISEMTKSVVTEAAKEVMQKIILYAEKLDYTSVFQYYSNDPEARHVVNGFLYPSVDAMKNDYDKMVPGIEYTQHSVKSWDVIVLSDDAALMTVPVQMKIKTKSSPEFKFDLVWSCVVQKRNDKWLVVQSHESWLNAAEVMAAMTAPETKKHK